MNMKQKLKRTLITAMLIVLLTACGSKGKLVGKYLKSETVTNGPVTLTTTYCVLVYEGPNKTQYTVRTNVSECK